MAPMRAAGPPNRPERCLAGCGRVLDQPATGRPRFFCSSACQRAASRRRAYDLPADSPRVAPEGRRTLPAILRRRHPAGGSQKEAS